MLEFNWRYAAASGSKSSVSIDAPIQLLRTISQCHLAEVFQLLGGILS
jgi:hypothetical protein